MLARLTPASRNQNERVEKTNRIGKPAEKPSSNKIATRFSKYILQLCNHDLDSDIEIRLMCKKDRIAE